MKTTKEQICEFLEKCDEITKCRFIMATAKIKDLLKCIVNSPELYGLFDKVTKDFNYIEQKGKCLISGSSSFSGKVVLPQTVGQRLAFIFCLLVEVDRGTVNLSDFLQVYFREDGSYFESYRAFCNLIIIGLKDLITQVFKDRLSATSEDEVDTQIDEKAKQAAYILAAIGEEKKYILKNISQEECEHAIKILDGLEKAIKSENEALIDALVCGYNYFILYNQCISDNVSALIENIVEFEKLL